MAGYSGTPLVKKLGIKADHRVALVHAPDAFERTLDGLPSGVALETARHGEERFDVVVLFAEKRSVLVAEFALWAENLQLAGGLWVAWPKKKLGVATDLTEDGVRHLGLAMGLVDNKICAIDETWSGLRFVYRLQDRPRIAEIAPDDAGQVAKTMIRILAALAVTVALGLASRLRPIGWYFYDKSLGDVLYAVAAYLVLVLTLRWKPWVVAAAALALCLAVEAFKFTGIPLQYSHILIVRWFLGTTFSWHNIACYAAGIGGIALIDWLVLRPGSTTSR